MIKAVQYGLGIGLILVGIAGLFLPILQGVLFIVLGVFVLRAHDVHDAWREMKMTAQSMRKRK